MILLQPMVKDPEDDLSLYFTFSKLVQTVSRYIPFQVVNIRKIETHSKPLKLVTIVSLCITIKID